jgi:hypothetical protein
VVRPVWAAFTFAMVICALDQTFLGTDEKPIGTFSTKFYYVAASTEYVCFSSFETEFQDIYLACEEIIPCVVVLLKFFYTLGCLSVGQ